jgi:hypothetical protein
MLEINTAEIEVEKPEVDPRTIEDGKRVDTPPVEAPTRPEGIPDELWDATSNDIKKDELIKAYEVEAKKAKDLRAIISKGIGKPAESLDEYSTVVIDENLQKYVGVENPALEAAKEAAFEAGIPVDKLTDFLNKYLSKGGEKGILAEATPRLTPEEQKTLQEAADKKFYDEQMKILGDEGQRQMKMLGNELGTLYQKGNISEKQLEVLKASLYDAEAINAFAAVVQVYKGQQVIPTQHAVDTGILSKSELEAMQKDPKFQNPEGYKKIMDGYRRLESAGML